MGAPDKINLSFTLKQLEIIAVAVSSLYHYGYPSDPTFHWPDEEENVDEIMESVTEPLNEYGFGTVDIDWVNRCDRVKYEEEDRESYR